MLLHLRQHGLVEDIAPTIARWAALAHRLNKPLRNPFTGHFDQTEIRNLKNFRPGLVARESLSQCFGHPYAICPYFHVDKVDDDNATDVTQPELTGHFCGRFKIIAVHGLFKVRFTNIFPGVDVDHR